MRILQIAPVPPEVGGVDAGGIATHAWGLATHLAERGHEVAVLADNRPVAAEGPVASGAERIAGVLVYGIRGYSIRRGPLSLANPRFLAQAHRAHTHLGEGWTWRHVLNVAQAYSSVIADFAPSVVHAHSLEGRFAFANAMLSQSVPLLATAHSTHYFEHAATPELSERHRALVARSLGKARDVLFVSGYLEDRFKGLFPAEFARIRGHVLPNPIDAKRYRAGREAAESDGAVGGYAGGEGDGGCGSGSGGGGTARPAFSRAEAWHQLGLPGDGRMLLFVGNLILRKAPQAFVRAVGELRADGRAVHGVLVGDGPERAATEALIQELGLGEAITLAGQKTQDELAAYYAAADIFVLPSLQESFGLVAVEAMLVGCPVVGTPDVLPEVVPPFAGSFVRSGMSLADAVANALDRTWDRDAIAAHALRYDWKVRIGDFERLYEAVGGQKRTLSHGGRYGTLSQ